MTPLAITAVHAPAVRRPRATPPRGRGPAALARGAAAILLLAAAVAGCAKPLPPTVGEPQDIMKNPDGVVGPMPGTPGYKPPKK